MRWLIQPRMLPAEPHRRLFHRRRRIDDPALRDVPSRWRFVASVGWLTLWVSLAACQRGANPRERVDLSDPERPIARVADRMLQYKDFEQFLQFRFSDAAASTKKNDEVLSRLFDEFVDRQLLLRECEKQQIDASEEEAKEFLLQTAIGAQDNLSRLSGERLAERIEETRADLRLDKFLKHYWSDMPAIPVGQQRKYFDDHRDEFREREGFRVAEILVKEAALANQVQAKLRRNGDFAALARQYSKGAQAAQGGVLGTFGRGELPEQFERVIVALHPGEVSPTLKTDFGHHIFKLLEIRPAREWTFEQAQPRIRRRLLDIQKQTALKILLQNLRREADVKIYRESLGFRYQEPTP